jgi:hypothetical protein
LIEKILKMPGKKILTLVMEENEEAFSIDVSEDGVFGYDEDAYYLLVAKLASALDYGGGLIIRQFLPEKIKATMPSGERRLIPKKNIYGINLSYGDWTPLSAIVVEQACNTDHVTGERLEPEVGVNYCAFPD